MLFPYWLTVVTVSLALYGLWHVFRDLLGLWAGGRPGRALSASLLVVVRNAEDSIEDNLRRLLYETALEPAWQEIIVVDHGSHDLTPAILDRLAAAYPLLKIVHLPPGARPVADAIPFCQGEVLEIIDLESRLGSADWDAAVSRLMRR
ncbi:glycosyltransferase [Anaeroselena agilis]|uniref:Glycosyltransferase n=1 Tax=Anaeroselena agilis TaxID=3063788 RepID=A0ABU3P4C2_9FIRM|nr:glycosyltransferase [Selenomonadales bacterium 4137-cl]